MASAVGFAVQTHSTYRQKQRNGSLLLVNLRTDALEDLENDYGDSQMTFPILCTFLYSDYEHVLSVYRIKLVTKSLKN